MVEGVLVGPGGGRSERTELRIQEQGRTRNKAALWLGMWQSSSETSHASGTQGGGQSTSKARTRGGAPFFDSNPAFACVPSLRVLAHVPNVPAAETPTSRGTHAAADLYYC